MSNTDNQNSFQNIPPNPPHQVTPPPKNGMATASMVLGIISLPLLLLSWGTLAIVSLILSFIGLPLGIVAIKAKSSGKATAGIVLNIITLAICALFFISCLACVGASRSGGDDEPEAYTNETTTASQEQDSTAEHVTEATEEEIEIVEATAEEILEAFDANEVRANSLYKDQTIRLTGIIKDISHSDFPSDRYTLSIGTGENYEFVTIRITATTDFEEQLMELEKGEEITVLFVCNGYIASLYVAGDLIEIFD